MLQSRKSGESLVYVSSIANRAGCANNLSINHEAGSLQLILARHPNSGLVYVFQSGCIKILAVIILFFNRQMASTRDILLATASTYISLYSFDETDFRAIRTPNCITRCITPSCRSSQTNEEILKEYPSFRAIFLSIKIAVIDPSQTIIDEKKRKVVLNLAHTSETTFGTVKNESITILTMNETGTLVDEISIFLDSLQYTTHQKLFRDAQAASK